MLSSIKLTSRSVRKYEGDTKIEDPVANNMDNKAVDTLGTTSSHDSTETDNLPQSSVTEPRRKTHSIKGRLVALDAARGLAVLGMYLQHFGSNPSVSAIVSGNTTLLFVLCGGISYSIMGQRMMDRGAEATTFRARMLARAVFVDIIGYLLIMLNTSYGIILPAYAAMFVLALMLFRRSTRTIVTTAVVLLVTAPPLMILGSSIFSKAYLLGDIAGGPMSALALTPAFVAGMAIGRVDLTRLRTALSLAGSGIVMLVIGKVMAAFVLPNWNLHFEQWLISVQGVAPVQPDEYAIWPLNTESPMWQLLLGTAPHTASTFQTMIGLGISFLVMGVTCLVSKKTSAVLMPFAAVGRVALTMYAFQFVVVWILDLTKIGHSLDGIPFGNVMIAVATLLLGLLIAQRPVGPLEGLMRRFDRLFSPTQLVSQTVK
ncbi:DUF418 domain-containing protein [Paenibacillus polymyxa]|uniref:DUF418 domain-containing protein n=1 Tax=Paenibacillus polymyxa TaxID=1406 RepID=UPI000D81C4AD|nr:DUF418 domain-containing protein [Paenibacillus polymyxa]KAE8560740.1 hypothetical protein BJH92_07390 [Paenibacillus polymyxa]MCJ1223171.1 DUF418 domain-containing protein [Paenibacillus polymyxa]MDU8674219.1 DUF418 domain-containing protein [Paenibacillus polymyxa]MDU8699127.1 DUF418 domain-containing protein [Paenibacillus polymyxa]URJ68309.1 DUF418 domain-containing protein [Paenibacillus polymyxa]